MKSVFDLDNCALPGNGEPARLVELGLAQRLPVLIGVTPFPSGRSARWAREKLYGTLIPEAT